MNRRALGFEYLAVLSAAVLCYGALGSVLSILPHYVPVRLGAGPTALGLSVAAPALAGLLARPFGGRMADRVGPLRPMLAGATLMAIGAVPGAVSATLGALLLSRLAVGVGEGMMMSATVLWLLRLAGRQWRGRALSHVGLANYAGLALGPLLAAAMGGAGASRSVLWTAAALPLLGAAGAITAQRLRATGHGRHGEPRRSLDRSRRSSTVRLLRLTASPGVGLLLVNIGYVSVLSFGGAVARRNGTGLQSLIVPVFAATVIISRVLGGSIPDQLGGRRSAALFAGAEAVGLLLYAQLASSPLALAALVILAVGQSFAVPGLALLALERVPRGEQGAAAGLFFAWFDAGVASGGPAIGAMASLARPTGALDAAAAAVATTILIAR